MSEQQYIPGMMGCSDGGCIFNFKERGTMVTNGGCQCQKELMRTDQGLKAVMTINFLRQNWPSMPFASMPEGYMTPVYQEVTHTIPKRTMQSKVNMIKDIRTETGSGLKECKEAMDAVYDSCTEYYEVVEKAVARIKGVTGYCRMGDNCLCGGDTPRVRFGCFEWKEVVQ